MTEETTDLIKKLRELSRLDGLILGVIAEKKKLGDALLKSEAVHKAAVSALKTKQGVLAERKVKAQKEDKLQKEEQDKLIKRRMALGTLGKGKAIEKAEAEIGHTARLLEDRENALLKEFDEIGELEKEAGSLKLKVTEEEGQLANLRKETTFTLQNLDERELDYREKRGTAAAKVDESSLSMYEKIREKYGSDIVVPVTDNNCPKCYMSVAPQLLVDIAKGNSLVRCRGCGRILFVQAG